MAHKELVEYFTQVKKLGLDTDLAEEEARAKKWSYSEIFDALAEIKERERKEFPPAPASVRLKQISHFSLELDQINAPQIIVTIGGISILISGMVYGFINWNGWNSFLRILAVAIPMLGFFMSSLYCYTTENYKKYSQFFAFVGTFLLQTLIVVSFNEFGSLKNNLNTVLFTISLLATPIYIGLRFIFKNSLWVVLHNSYLLLGWYNVLRILGLQSMFENSLILAAIVPISIIYALVGIWEEKNELVKYAEYTYAFMFVAFLIPLFIIVFRGDLGGWTGITSSKIDSIGFSAVILGLILLLGGRLLAFAKSLGLSHLSETAPFIRELGWLSILGGVFYLGTGGKKILYEIALMLISLFAIVSSMLIKSQSIFLTGFGFFVLFIFTISIEYLSSEIDLPIILFITGIIAISVGLGVDKLRRHIFQETA